MCDVAFTTVVFVDNYARTCYPTCTVTQMIAICKMNGARIRQLVGGSFQCLVNPHRLQTLIDTNYPCSKQW